MNRAFLTIIFCLIGIITASGQQTCPSGSQCTANSTLERCANVADELKAARDVISKFEAERTTTTAERTAAQTLIKSLNDVLEVRGRIIAEYDKMVVVYQKVIDMQSALIDSLTKKLNAPKSAWHKLVDALKTLSNIAIGIGIGTLL